MELRLKWAPTPENAPRFAALTVQMVRDIEGAELDGSAASLEILDAILDAWHAKNAPVDRIGETLFTFGCYLGEVFVREVGAKWVVLEAEEGEGYAPMLLELGERGLADPIGKVRGRVVNGKEDFLPYYFAALTSGLPKPPRPSFFKRLFS